MVKYYMIIYILNEFSKGTRVLKQNVGEKTYRRLLNAKIVI